MLLGPAVLALAWPAVALAQDPVPDSARPHQASAQLFASHEPLPLTIEAPFTSIFKEREDDAKEFPGKVTVHSADRPSVALDVDIRTRGKARLSRQICQFPPLRLDFPRTRVESTVFAGQDRLKLVTHCQDGRGEYEQYVLQEYLVYRVLNLLTDLSFLVRLVRGTYVDTEAKTVRVRGTVEDRVIRKVLTAAGYPPA